MKLNELYTMNHLPVQPPWHEREDFEYDLQQYGKKLQSMGFKLLGQGNYGLVFTNQSLGYAVKIFTSMDGGYLSFLRFVLAHRGNIHLPKIRGRFKRINDQYSACRMELLEPVGWDEKMSLDVICNELRDTNDIDVFISRFRGVARDARPALFTDYFLTTVFVLYSKRGHYFDLHGQNVMMRDGNTLVITDPYA